MLFCNVCGRELTEYDSTCPECGAVIQEDMITNEKYKYGLLLTLSVTVLLVILNSLVFSNIYLLCFPLFLPIIFIKKDFSRFLIYVMYGVFISFIISEILYYVYE